MGSDLWHRWQKAFEIVGGGIGGGVGYDYSIQQLWYLGVCPTRKSKNGSEAIFWTETCHYSDKNIFAALVHSALDS